MPTEWGDVATAILEERPWWDLLWEFGEAKGYASMETVRFAVVALVIAIRKAYIFNDVHFDGFAPLEGMDDHTAEGRASTALVRAVIASLVDDRDPDSVQAVFEAGNFLTTLTAKESTIALGVAADLLVEAAARPGNETLIIRSRDPRTGKRHPV